MDADKELGAFLERIGKRLSEDPGAPQSGRHRAAFIALRALIEGALAHGYTMKATWAALREEKKLSMSYQTFRMHCRRAGIGQEARVPAPAPLAPPETPRATIATPKRSGPMGMDPGSRDGEPRAFRHERVPRKGDIYG